MNGALNFSTLDGWWDEAWTDADPTAPPIGWSHRHSGTLRRRRGPRRARRRVALRRRSRTRSSRASTSGRDDGRADGVAGVGEAVDGDPGADVGLAPHGSRSTPSRATCPGWPSSGAAGRSGQPGARRADCRRLARLEAGWPGSRCAGRWPSHEDGGAVRRGSIVGHPAGSRRRADLGSSCGWPTEGGPGRRARRPAVSRAGPQGSLRRRDNVPLPADRATGRWPPESLPSSLARSATRSSGPDRVVAAEHRAPAPTDELLVELARPARRRCELRRRSAVRARRRSRGAHGRARRPRRREDAGRDPAARAVLRRCATTAQRGCSSRSSCVDEGVERGCLCGCRADARSLDAECSHRGRRGLGGGLPGACDLEPSRRWSGPEGSTARRLARSCSSAPCPLGYHHLELPRSGAAAARRRSSATLAAGCGAASRGTGAPLGSRRPVFSLHSARSWGSGDSATSTSSARLAADQHASVVSTLPLLAAFGPADFEASPYRPVSRRFWSDRWIASTGSTPRRDRAARPRLLDERDLLAARLARHAVEPRRCRRAPSRRSAVRYGSACAVGSQGDRAAAARGGLRIFRHGAARGARLRPLPGRRRAVRVRTGGAGRPTARSGLLRGTTSTGRSCATHPSPSGSSTSR